MKSLFVYVVLAALAAVGVSGLYAKSNSAVAKAADCCQGAPACCVPGASCCQ